MYLGAISLGSLDANKARQCQTPRRVFLHARFFHEVEGRQFACLQNFEDHQSFGP